MYMCIYIYMHNYIFNDIHTGISGKFHFCPEDAGLLPPVPRSVSPATPLEVLLMPAEALVPGRSENGAGPRIMRI